MWRLFTQGFRLKKALHGEAARAHTATAANTGANTENAGHCGAKQYNNWVVALLCILICSSSRGRGYRRRLPIARPSSTAALPR